MLRAWSLLVLLLSSQAAHAQQVKPGDPRAYDLRTALYPLSFQAGASQSAFGLAGRVEYALLRRMDLSVFGRLALWNVSGEQDRHAYTLGGTLSFHVIEQIDREPLLGTVHPANAGTVSGRTQPGSDCDFEMPMSARLGGPPFPLDYDATLSAEMRTLHSLRVGLQRSRAIEQPYLGRDGGSYLDNRLWIAQLGYAYATHWNLAPDVTGKPEIGYRRFYVDALATLPGLVDARPLYDSMGVRPRLIALGARVGMQGAIEGLLRSVPGAGFGYTLELGMLPGRGGLEGYLFIGLGLSLDVATRAR